MAVLKTVDLNGSVGSNPTSSAKPYGEMTELAEGARLLSECRGYTLPRVRISLSPPYTTITGILSFCYEFPFCVGGVKNGVKTFLLYKKNIIF